VRLAVGLAFVTKVRSAEMEAAGGALSAAMACDAVAVHPDELVTVTV
jgi:hypothetical protein